MFVLNSNISIGKFQGVKPVEVKVSKSMYQMVDRATITLPISARIRRMGSNDLVSVETANVIEEGDAVRVELGYNGVLREEFTGFVSRVNFTSPVEVECEGYSYLLRKKQYRRTFKKSTLLEVLKFLVEGTAIQIDEKQVPYFPVVNFSLAGDNGVEALEKLKTHLKGAPTIMFSGPVMYAGLLGLNYKLLDKFPVKPHVQYLMGWNVIKDGNLKRREAKNEEVEVTYIGEKADGTKVQASYGKGRKLKAITTHGVLDKQALLELAAAKHLRLTYDGYEGKITAFLQPYCEPAFRVELEDRRYPERSGRYLVESTEVTYGVGGARRTVGIGLKL